MGILTELELLRSDTVICCDNLCSIAVHGEAASLTTAMEKLKDKVCIVFYISVLCLHLTLLNLRKLNFF